MKNENTFLENKGDVKIFTVYICTYILVLLFNLFYYVFTFRIYIYLEIHRFWKCFYILIHPYSPKCFATKICLMAKRLILYNTKNAPQYHWDKMIYLNVIFTSRLIRWIGSNKLCKSFPDRGIWKLQFTDRYGSQSLRLKNKFK